MSDVASLENCRELYELSGWTDTKEYYHPELFFVPSTTKNLSIAPAYSAGYLLRKLPRFVRPGNELSMTILGDEVHFIYPDGYGGATFKGIDKYPYFENALAKLAIELFKQGILTKGLPHEPQQQE